MFKSFCHYLPKVLFFCGLLPALLSCTLVEERIDRAAGGPNVPADTDVSMRPDSVEQPEKKPLAALPADPMKITITEAILLSLENNRALVVERLNPSIQQTF